MKLFNKCRLKIKTMSSIYSAKKVLLVVVGLMSWVVNAQSVEQNIIAKLARSAAQLEVVSVVESQWKGLYEVTLSSGAIIFSNAQANYLLTGEMHQITADQRIVNLSEQKFAKQVATKLASVSPADQIVYPATKERTQVTVFTDISCYFCKKLHNAIPELQRRGVTVKYMAFPRAGANSQVAAQMAAIWCAKDKAAAMTQAKNGERIAPLECANPVAEQFVFGNRIGVNATPTIFTAQGEKIAGFASAADLLNQLELN